MAICDYCNQEMSENGISCLFTPGKIPHQIEILPKEEWLDEWRKIYPNEDTEESALVRYARYVTGRCHDCGVRNGGYHHPGCDAERCPTCDGQWISCSCDREEEDDE